MASTSIRRAICFDLEGTLWIGSEWIPGCVEVVRSLLRNPNVLVQFVTNKTSKPIEWVHEFLEMGLSTKVDISSITTPVEAACSWFDGLPPSERHPVFAIASDKISHHLSGCMTLTKNWQEAGYVLLSDVPRETHCSALDDALNALVHHPHCRLVAMALNRNYVAEGSYYRMDVGAYANALSFASQKPVAQVFGKPSASFYEAVLRRNELGVLRDKVLMVGDDVEGDAMGAQAVGIRGVQVRTGKFRADWVSRHSPNHVIDSVALLPQLLDEIGFWE